MNATPSTRDLLRATKCWLPLLLLGLTSCSIHIRRHHSSSHQTSVAATPEVRWTDEQALRLRYGIRDEQTALESDRVVLVFHGLTPTQQGLFHFQGAEQAIQVAGPGVSTVSVTCSTERGSVALTSHYAEGTNTLQFERQTVRFVDRGWRLLAGDQSVDLSESRKVIHLRNGRATVE